MGAVILDASTVRNFVNNEEEFNKSTDADFAAFDIDGDGALSKAEMRKTLESFRLIDTDFGVDGVAPTQEELTALYDSIFEKFDTDRDGAVRLQEFRDGMKMMALAVADGIGSHPIRMALEDYDYSFLKRAVDFEASLQA